MKLQVPFFPKKSSRSTIKSPDSSSCGNRSDVCSSFCGSSCGRAGKKSPSRVPWKNAAKETFPSDRPLSAFEIFELEETFKHFDANHDGKISVTELGSVLRQVGDNATEQELRQMVRDVDKDGDGFVNLEEFLSLHSSCGGAWRSHAELREAFQFFDADKNGYISVEELRNALRRLDKECTVEECMKMIKGVDEDGDNRVSFEEFQKMMA